MKVLIAISLLALGIGWYVFMEWLRDRPRFLEQGTQHILMFGYMGLVACIFIAILILIK